MIQIGLFQKFWDELKRKLKQRKENGKMEKKRRLFWEKVGRYFCETEKVLFDHSIESDADTIVRQLDKVVNLRENMLCDTGYTHLPRLRDFPDEWYMVSEYLAQNTHRTRCDVLAELKLFASGVRDGRLSSSASLLLPP